MHAEQPYYFISSVVTSLVNSVKSVPQHPQKIIVVKNDEIGDMVYALHVLRALRSQYSSAEITLLCTPVNASWISELKLVDVIIHDISDRSGHYDIWIELRGWYSSLMASLADLNSYRVDRGTQRIKNKISGEQLHERFTNWNIVKGLLGEDVPEIDLAIPDDISSKARVLIPQNEHGYVVFHCGAREANRRWAKEHFAKLADLLWDEYRTPVILVGAQNESDLNKSVKAMTKGNVVDLSGKTSILEMAAIIRDSRCYVGNESGPLHFAIVQKKPLVALFGPGVRNVFYPFHENQYVIHPESNKTNRHTSMERINYYVVVEQVKSLMDL